MLKGTQKVGTKAKKGPVNPRGVARSRKKTHKNTVRLCCGVLNTERGYQFKTRDGDGEGQDGGGLTGGLLKKRPR